MKNGSIQKVIQEYCKKADVQKHCHVHLFRKTLATRLYKHGMELPLIAKILGHKTIKTTEKFYLSIRDQDIRYLYHKYAA
jgi:site-specific recombinase XerD